MLEPQSNQSSKQLSRTEPTIQYNTIPAMAMAMAMERAILYTRKQANKTNETPQPSTRLKQKTPAQEPVLQKAHRTEQPSHTKSTNVGAIDPNRRINMTIMYASCFHCKKIGDAFEEGFQAEEARLMEAEQKKIARTSKSPKSNNEYQFVGVVQPQDKQVKWYARPKPKNSSWSVRVVNVDKAAILRDMFVRGKVDIYGEYQNKGLDAATIASASAKTKKSSENEEEVSKVPLIQAEYTVKERSWKTLWNFSPKAFFTDRSGNYWRQRRLTPGASSC